MFVQGILKEGEGSDALLQLLLIESILLLFNETNYLYEEVNCTEAFPSVKGPFFSG